MENVQVQIVALVLIVKMAVVPERTVVEVKVVAQPVVRVLTVVPVRIVQLPLMVQNVQVQIVALVNVVVPMIHVVGLQINAVE